MIIIYIYIYICVCVCSFFFYSGMFRASEWPPCFQQFAFFGLRRGRKRHSPWPLQSLLHANWSAATFSRLVSIRVFPDGFVWKWLVPLNPVVLLIIIPIQWLFHWEYTLFSDKPRYHWIALEEQNDPWWRVMNLAPKTLETHVIFFKESPQGATLSTWMNNHKNNLSGIKLSSAWIKFW